MQEIIKNLNRVRRQIRYNNFLVNIMGKPPADIPPWLSEPGEMTHPQPANQNQPDHADRKK